MRGGCRPPRPRCFSADVSRVIRLDDRRLSARPITPASRVLIECYHMAGGRVGRWNTILCTSQSLGGRYFGNERHEMQRYDEIMANYQVELMAACDSLAALLGRGRRSLRGEGAAHDTQCWQPQHLPARAAP